MTETVIATHGLQKRYGAVHAVDGIDLDVRAGDVYGFLGANGSGKTTTVRMLLGLVLPTKGEVRVLGQRMPKASREVLPRVGALIEGPAAYGHLSGTANLRLLDAAGPGGSRRSRKQRVGEVLEQGQGRRVVEAGEGVGAALHGGGVEGGQALDQHDLVPQVGVEVAQDRVGRALVGAVRELRVRVGHPQQPDQVGAGVVGDLGGGLRHGSSRVGGAGIVAGSV